MRKGDLLPPPPPEHRRRKLISDSMERAVTRYAEAQDLVQVQEALNGLTYLLDEAKKLANHN